MSIKPKLEALIYAAEEPIGVDQLAALLRDDLLALKVTSVAEPETPQPPVDTESAEARLGAIENQPPGSPTGGGFSLGEVETPGPPARGDVPRDGAENKRPPDQSEKVELRALL